MDTAIHLAYLGSDSEFYKELSSYVSNYEVGEFGLKEVTYQKGGLVELISAFSPQIVYIDLTLIIEVGDLLNEVIYIKRNTALKRILFVAIFPDQLSLDANRTLLTTGFQLFFIKGSETISLFRDSAYIAYDAISDFPTFSRARRINKNITMGSCATLYSVVGNDFILETDLDIPFDSINLKLPLFPDLTSSHFSIKERGNFIANYPMTTSFLMQLPLADAWSEVSTDFVLQDTIDTWKDFNKEMLAEEPICIEVISKSKKIFHEIFKFYDPALFNISFTENVDIENIQNKLECKNPPLIFFENDVEHETENFNQLSALVMILSSFSDYMPIVICTNTPSKTSAIQKLLNYKNVICFDKPLNGEIFSSLTKSFIAKRKKTDSTHFIFDVAANGRILDVKFDVELTSLTEHEITFYCSVPLPMFSLLHFNLPIEFIATVVPPIYDLTNRAESNQYMAFINGIDEAGLSLLRKFINQIIYNPPPDYSDAAIAQVVKSMNAVKKEDLAMPPEQISLKKVEKIEQKDSEVFKENRFQGKSKL